MKPNTFNDYEVRLDFPIFKVNQTESSLVYLDSAASTQKPHTVIDHMHNFYAHQYSNVHRGIYKLSEQATSRFEGVRKKLQRWVNAARVDEIVFTRGATESINLVAQSYIAPSLTEKDTILISHMEHHANIVPWQRLCMQTGAQLNVIPVNNQGELVLDDVEKWLKKSPKLLAVTHLSNVLGTLNPLEKLIQLAHQYGVPVLVDGAQAVAHCAVDVQSLDCDFYVFSGHKMYGPNGIGVLYAKFQHLNNMPPWQGGGGMIQRVTFEKTEYREPPYRFEAGTPCVPEAIGLGSAIDYLDTLDKDTMRGYEQQLTQYADQKLREFPGLRLIGNTANRISVFSFILNGIHAHDIATILDQDNIAVRAGHHCAMPLMDYFEVPATVRVSLGIYNTFEDIDRLIAGLQKVQKLLG